MIYLVRQTQTDWNLFHRFNGGTETYLNQTGVEQAMQIGEQLQEIEFDQCFCSPQIRAIQTAQLIHKGAMVTDARLREILCGEFEGQEENRESMNLYWQASKNGEKGVENIAAFMERNIEFCEMIAKEQKGKNVLIVTHAANARIIHYYFTGRPKDYDFMKPVGHGGGYLVYENQ